jgi:Kef-type K+ transport system membrane component KefB/mannitol/fructose-specific phosphotransferase system IIA component (Ntr-type)/nucleotide-binding universal stress UspA family protein
MIALSMAAPLTLPITDPVLIVAIAGAIFLLAPLLMQRFGVPGLIGIILSGTIVGPNGLNILARDQTIVLLGTVGLLYLMFMAGTEIDLHGFKRYRNRSLIFGSLTFLIPQISGTAIFLMLGFSWPAAILIASMFASHTLVSYPIAMRFGIAKNQAVTTAVGGTIITDTAALLVLAVVAASTRGALDASFWIQLVVFLAIYVVLVWFGLPRLGRWFFRREKTGGISEYLFIFTALFAGAYMAEVAGVEAIVGAFLVGLALNRLIPEQSLLNNRIHFIGESIFIPFFLLSVGMLVDVRVLAADVRAWEVMLAMTITVILSKWIAAKAAERIFGYSREEGWTIFGLSVPQAAATLAATLIGVEVGLFDDAVLNGAVMMILVTCLLGPWVTERYGREVALQEEQRPYDPSEAPQRILVPMAKPATAEDLMNLALLIREPDSPEAVYPMTVVPADADRSSEFVATAEKMLSHAVTHAAGAGVPVVPLTRVDHNFANGIARGIAENRASTVIIGWDGSRSARRGIFGSVLDQLLEQTRQQVLVTKVGHPLNTTERIIVLVPQGADHVPGFLGSLRTIKQMANRLGARIHGYSVRAPARIYQAHFDSVKPEAPTTVERASGWGDAVQLLAEDLQRDDLVVVLSSRRGTIAWDPALERLPAKLADLVPESFIMMYPSETLPSTGGPTAAGELPRTLSPDRVRLNLTSSDYRGALRELLGTQFESEPQRLREIEAAVARSVKAFAPELQPGVIVPHARIPDLSRTLVFLGTSREGIEFPHAAEPARLIFIVLTPEDQPQEHLSRLAEIARLVSDPDEVERLVQAESTDDLSPREAQDRLSISSRPDEPGALAAPGGVVARLGEETTP